MKFKGRDVLVTGGNSGIGRAIVHHFLKAGARVAFVGRDPEKGRAVEAEARAVGERHASLHAICLKKATWPR